MEKYIEYEKLVEYIYSTISKDAVVKHNDYIQGRKSKRMRQIDVSIRSTISGHEILIIVQCKNYKRSIDVNAIGEFQSVIEDVSASKGIFISNSKFTNSAKNLANEYNIDLCSIHEAMKKDWNLDIKVPIYICPVIPVLMISFVTEKVTQDLMKEIGSFYLVDYYNLFSTLWIENKFPKAGGTYLIGDLEVISKLTNRVYSKYINKIEAGYVIEKKAFLSYIEELPNTKSLYNHSLNKYSVLFSYKDIPWPKEIILKETKPPNINNPHSIIIHSIEAPVIGLNSGKNKSPFYSAMTIKCNIT